MAWTQSDIDQLKKAIATGALRVRYADNREVQYRSLKEMRETLAMMEAELNPPARRITFAGYSGANR